MIAAKTHPGRSRHDLAWHQARAADISDRWPATLTGRELISVSFTSYCLCRRGHKQLLLASSHSVGQHFKHNYAVGVPIAAHLLANRLWPLPTASTVKEVASFF